MRKAHGLPPRPAPPGRGAGAVRFHPAPRDAEALDTVTREARGRPYVLFAATAGLPERDIPADLVEGLAARVLERDLLPVFTGRDYARGGRREYRPRDRRCLDLVDRLSVPGTARLLEGAAGLITCHSALNLLAWRLRKPQLLLYPGAVFERHIRPRDAWAFGADYPECFHGLFGAPDILSRAGRFLDSLEPDSRPGGPETRPPGPATRARITETATPKQENATMVSLDIPPECAAIPLDETIGRLTPVHEVRYLCWLAGTAPGNWVEIGCNKGLTTRDIAAHNPRKIIYAVDWFAGDGMAEEQKGERPGPHDFCVYARRLRNVVCLHARSAEINYRALVDVGVVFIDGDHSHAAVKADTEAALEYFRDRRGGGIIVWHDYYEDAPRWVGVKPYVDSLDLPLERIRGTWLATARIRGRE